MKPARFLLRSFTDSIVPYAIAIVVLMVSATLIRTHGEFTYSLDDPYIHMTLARNILHGNYGVNAGEYASPSSSILWPFILVPFADSKFFLWVPLIINALCFVCILKLLFSYIKKDVSDFTGIVIVLILVPAFNLPALMMMGMEHSLQVLLVLIVALQVVEDSPNVLLFYVAAIALPLVRYEDLAITVPALAYRYWQGQRRGPIVALVAVVALVAGFSLFMKHLGLDYLPSSVMAKLDFQPSRSALGIAKSVFDNFRSNSSSMLFNSLLVVFAALLYFQLRGEAKHAVVMLVVPTLLIYAFGKNGWGDRYQVHILVYCFVLLWSLPRDMSLTDFHRRFGMPIATIVMLSNFGFIHNLINSPLSSKNIHDQQYQLAEIVRDYLKEPVAVNDLGMVSYYGHQYVLDLWGLGSLDALKTRIANPTSGWIGQFMQGKGVEFAFIYSEWFPGKPSSWIQVGRLTLPDKKIAPASSVVVLYATNAAAASRLEGALEHYRNSSPLAQQIVGMP